MTMDFHEHVHSVLETKEHNTIRWFECRKSLVHSKTKCTRCDIIDIETLQRVVYKTIEFNLSIAENVWIGCITTRVVIQCGFEDIIPVFSLKIHLHNKARVSSFFFEVDTHHEAHLFVQRRRECWDIYKHDGRSPNRYDQNNILLPLQTNSA